MTPDDACQRLLARKTELLQAEMRSVDDRAPVTLQQDSVGRLSRMGAMQQQAMAQATQRRREDEARRIEAALERIREGEWGWCLSCGEEIAVGRLDRDPAVTLCLACADRR